MGVKARIESNAIDSKSASCVVVMRNDGKVCWLLGVGNRKRKESSDE